MEHNDHTCSVRILVAVVAVCLSAHEAGAQGLALRGVGPVNRSMGGAAVAAPLDAVGALHWNPATIGGLPSSEMRIGLELLDPETALSSETVQFGLGPVPTSRLAGATRGNSGRIPVPSAALVRKLDGSRWTFGLGLFGIAGLEVRYPASATNPILRPRRRCPAPSRSLVSAGSSARPRSCSSRPQSPTR
ncbi:MAG: outer membrane protein transport protein [Vicinamibacterales bacterium]|nr:outer membrane protein transport protein [Vicinamibacterales bacterium]